MNMNITLTGMVIASTPVGDYDKRLVILTKERGKITAFARGAKKPTSQFLAVSQPFVYGKFTVYEGRTAYNLSQAEISEFFVELRNDLDLVSYGLYFCELVDYYVRENQRDDGMLSLMYATMEALREGIMPVKMIKSVCELKMAAISGEAPLPYECVCCHTNENLVGISFSGGGAVCKAHENMYKDVIHMEMPAIYAVYYVITSDVEKIYHFRLDEMAMGEFNYYMKRYMKKFVDRDFKSLQMLLMI